jgi:hypothetical protein
VRISEEPREVKELLRSRGNRRGAEGRMGIGE